MPLPTSAGGSSQREKSRISPDWKQTTYGGQTRKSLSTANRSGAIADGTMNMKKADSLNPPASISVRPATHEDLPRILQIERAAETAAHWVEADYGRALADASPQRVLLVAESASVTQEFPVQGVLVARSMRVSEWGSDNVV